MNEFDKFKDKMNKVDGALETIAPQQYQLGEVTELINKKLKLENEQAQILMRLNYLNGELENLNSKLIPNKMMELGLSKVTTASGAEVSINKLYRGNISEKHSIDALKWFIETKQVDSIKNEYKVTLGVGNTIEAESLKNLLLKNGYKYNNKQSIAWNTLSGIIRDLDSSEELNENKSWLKLQKEERVPKDLSLRDALGVFIKNETKLKFKKK